MKAASGETDNGGETKLWPMVEGLSLEILCVLDLGRRGEAMDGDRARDDGSGFEPVMVALFLCQLRESPPVGSLKEIAL